MYQLTPPNIRSNPFPYFKLQEYGLTQEIINKIEESMQVRPAKYITDDDNDNDDAESGEKDVRKTSHTLDTQRGRRILSQ